MQLTVHFEVGPGGFRLGVSVSHCFPKLRGRALVEKSGKPLISVVWLVDSAVDLLF